MASLTSSSIIRTSEKRTPGKQVYRFLRYPIAVIVPLLLLLWYMGVFGGNVRTVEAGRAYRSAAITGSNLETVLQEKGIKTVLNLRGGSDKDEWYRSELETTRKFGAKHLDFAFSAVKYPPPAELVKLISAFEHAEYPILFHCRGGADRSGLAAALYLHLMKGVPLDEAQHQGLTWRYGHLSFGQAHAMDDFFTLYRKTGGGMPLREWILKRYPALHNKLPAGQKVKDYDTAKE